MSRELAWPVRAKQTQAGRTTCAPEPDGWPRTKQRAKHVGADHAAGRHGADARMHARQDVHEPGLQGLRSMGRKTGAPRRRVRPVRRARAREPEPDSGPGAGARLGSGRGPGEARPGVLPKVCRGPGRRS
jgi:hypothetical protein